MTKKKTPMLVLRKESEASQLLHPKTTETTRPISLIEVRPEERSHVSLGDFTTNESPKGFVLEITPDIKENVTSQITRLGAEYDEYELILHVMNRSNTAIEVEIHQF